MPREVVVPPSVQTVTVGVVSDTHGLVRPEALKLLRGSDLILHAGDIGDPSVITALEAIAPVHAVRGNVDRDPWTSRYPETLALQVGGRWIFVLHDVGQLDLDPAAGGFAAVVHGHSHMPRNEPRGPVLFFNPGSAGPRRFHLPVAVGRLIVRQGRIAGELFPIDV